MWKFRIWTGSFPLEIMIYTLASLLHLDQEDTDYTEDDADLIYSRETFLKIQNSHKNDDDEIDNSDDGYGFR